MIMVIRLTKITARYIIRVTYKTDIPLMGILCIIISYSVSNQLNNCFINTI
jgi:hypothetical protein